MLNLFPFRMHNISQSSLDISPKYLVIIAYTISPNPPNLGLQHPSSPFNPPLPSSCPIHLCFSGLRPGQASFAYFFFLTPPAAVVEVVDPASILTARLRGAGAGAAPAG